MRKRPRTHEKLDLSGWLSQCAHAYYPCSALYHVSVDYSRLLLVIVLSILIQNTQTVGPGLLPARSADGRFPV